jgi:CBS-domain-containing membrane protein
MAIGARLAVLLASVLGEALGSIAPLPWIVAPMGASAVLVF